MSEQVAGRAGPGLFESTLAGWDRRDDCWVFGYASLLWRPEFDASEVRRARLWGWHRALEMRSRVNRGTPDVPGLVFALVPGGSCTGHALRIPKQRAEAELVQLWQREMPSGGVYTPRWLRCDTPHGPVQALTFTLARHHPNYTGPLDDPALDAILRRAHGRFGSTLDYLLQTADQLERLGIRDRKLERIAALGRRIALESAAAHAGVHVAAQAAAPDAAPAQVPAGERHIDHAPMVDQAQSAAVPAG